MSMTTTTTSSTDLDSLLAAVLVTPIWIDEPDVERLVKVLLLDPHAARPSNLIDEANRSGWDDLRTMAAKVVDSGCHAAVRRRADEVGFHVRRIASLLGRCVDLPADTGNEIRNLLRNSLLGNATREALVRVLRAAGASHVARALVAPVENNGGQAKVAVGDGVATAEHREEPSAGPASAPRRWHSSEEEDGSIVFGDGVDRGRIPAKATTMLKLMRALLAAGPLGVKWEELRRQQVHESGSRCRIGDRTHEDEARRLARRYFPAGMRERLQVTRARGWLDTADR